MTGWVILIISCALAQDPAANVPAVEESVTMTEESAQQPPSETALKETPEPGVAPEPSMDNSPVEELFQPTPQKVGIEKLLSPFSYDPTVFRDPYRRPEGRLPLVERPLYGPFLPEQQYRLEDLDLRGVLMSSTSPKALIAVNLKEGKTKIYRIGIKGYIGENFGYVAKILPSQVVIVQTKEQKGKTYSTTKTLSIEK